MPSWGLFGQQDEEYRHSVLPPACTARIAVEQASTIGWDRYVGPTGRIIGMHTFGASAPLKALLTKFGFTPDKVLADARALVARSEEHTSELQSLMRISYAVFGLKKKTTNLYMTT